MSVPPTPAVPPGRPTGPTDPTGPSSGTERTERPHPATPLVRGWFVFAAILFAFLRESITDRGQGSGPAELLRLGVVWILVIIFGVVAVAALAGFVSWYFTRFVIDDRELRVETGALFRSSRRLAFERVQSVDIVQPFLARIFGLAELKIEAGGGDRGVRLRYLKRDKADEFRHYLLARAHGDRVALAGSADRARAGVFTDLSVEDHPIVTIGPKLLILGFLLSSEWLISLLALLVAFVVTTSFGVTLYALPGLVPLAFGALGLIGRRVIAQFNYTLAESDRGLRITRGLTNLLSQSVPIDRIQGLKISQSLLWRPFGWYRVDVSVLGRGADSERSESRSDVSRILLPVATAAQLQTALSRVLPGLDLDAISLHRSPPQAKIIRPLDAWTFRYGYDDQVMISRAGVLVNDTVVVPHAKAQSARLEQGPLQRLLGLADVHLDSPRGPVRLLVRHIGADVARELVLAELDRGRRAAPPAPAPAPAPAVTQAANRPAAADAALLARFGLPQAELLGEGGESRVYALDDQRVLRVYKSGHEAAGSMIEQLQPAYRYWAGADTPLELPQILDHGVTGDRVWSVDRRMSGMSFSRWLRQARPEQRRPALLSYLDSAFEIQRLGVPDGGWARLFGSDPRTFPTLAALIHDQLHRALQRIDPVVFPEAESWARQVVDEIGERRCAPRLVHADYFPGNTYARVEDAWGAAPRTVVRGVGDFSPHTLVADPIMDVAGASILMELEEYDGVVQDARWLADVAAERVGPEEARWFDSYRRYYSVYFGDDPAVVSWSRRQFAETREAVSDSRPPSAGDDRAFR